MGKNRDLIQILAIVIIGMFIPFCFSIAVIFQLNLSTWTGWKQIITTFGIFLLIFGFELLFVFLYFHITNTLAEKKINKQKQQRQNQ